MNENQFFSIKPKWMLVKPFKPASLPADVGFASRNGCARKPGSSAAIVMGLQQPIALLGTLRSRQLLRLDLTDVETNDQNAPRHTLG